MPYIKQEDRNDLKWELDKALGACKTPGELNYFFTCLLLDYIGKPSYTKINEAVGVLECCKLELYRKLAAVYEDKKAEENGDVYK